MTAPTPDLRLIRWFGDLAIGDIPQVGGKNASLGEMVRELASAGVKVPNGFAVTAEGYRHFIRSAGLDGRIREILAGLDTGDMQALDRCGHLIRHAILDAELPEDLQAAIRAAYAKLGEGMAQVPAVAVRSSATAEDLPDASFAGQSGVLPQCAGRNAAAGGLQTLLRFAVHRPGHQLPGGQRL